MKNKHILSVLLVIVLMIISFSAVSAAQPQTDSIRLDFKEFAMAASEEPWWSDLGEALHEDIKYVGCINYKETMPESMQTAYDAMLEWSQSRSFWTIDAEQTDLSNPWYWKVLYLNADPGQAWAFVSDRVSMEMPLRIWCWRWRSPRGRAAGIDWRWISSARR